MRDDLNLAVCYHMQSGACQVGDRADDAAHGADRGLARVIQGRHPDSAVYGTTSQSSPLVLLCEYTCVERGSVCGPGKVSVHNQTHISARFCV